MFFHGGIRAHAVEKLVVLAVTLHQLAAAFIVAGQHPPQHDKIRPTAKRLRYIPGSGATAVRDDSTTETVSGIGTLDNGRQLRVADPGLDPGGTDRTRADANLDDIRT